MTVFEAFPNAIISNVWRLGRVTRGTAIGTKFAPVRFLDVIVDEGVSGNLDAAPNAEGVVSDILIYAKPEQVGSANMAKFVGNYYLYNCDYETFYEIVDAGLGFNQDKGVVEHVEFKLKPTEVAEIVEGEI